jgi:DNA-binding CsgD family transcriptional regulator
MIRAMSPVHEEAPWAGSLSGVDLDHAAETIYRVVVAEGHLSLAALGDRAGLSDDVVEVGVARLQKFGLITVDDETVTAYPPAPALGALVAERERGAREARAALDQITAAYLQSREAKLSEGIEIVRGRREIGAWMASLLLTARDELRMFAKPPFMVVGIGETEEERKVAERGIRERVIIERTVLNEPEAEKVVLASLDRGQEIRLAQTLPAKLLILDDAIAVVQLDSGGPDHSEVAIVRRGGLLDCLIFSFESLWRTANQLREVTGRRVDPFPPSPEEVADPVDREVLTLLLAGYTDAQVASRLGIGLRTVQRRVRRLMDVAGTDSRVFLGWYARDRGWL